LFAVISPDNNSEPPSVPKIPPSRNACQSRKQAPDRRPDRPLRHPRSEPHTGTRAHARAPARAREPGGRQRGRRGIDCDGRYTSAARGLQKRPSWCTDSASTCPRPALPTIAADHRVDATRQSYRPRRRATAGSSPPLSGPPAHPLQRAGGSDCGTGDIFTIAHSAYHISCPLAIAHASARPADDDAARTIRITGGGHRSASRGYRQGCNTVDGLPGEARPQLARIVKPEMS
jgi:hypothetical protein